MLLIFNLFIHHRLIGKFYLVLASLRSSFASLAKGQWLHSFFNLDIMVVVLRLILAAFGPALSSFHQSVHGGFEFDGGGLFELLSLFHDGLFVFGALGPSPASMFGIAVDGGFLIILSDGPFILP